MDVEKEYDSKEVLQMVTFNLGNEEYSVDILKVQEIIRLMEITRVPNAADFIDGVINLRGKVIAVMDLRKRFGMALSDDSSEARIIVVDLDGLTIGLKVDAVSEVLRLPADKVDPAPSLSGKSDSDYIQGIGKLDDRLIILLNVERLLSEHEKETLNRVADPAA